MTIFVEILKIDKVISISGGEIDDAEINNMVFITHVSYNMTWV